MFKNVTDNQGLGFARMARAKGLSRQQFTEAEEDGTWGRCLDAVRDRLPIVTGLSIKPPLGCRIHSVRVRKLRLDRGWEEAIKAACPNTPIYEKEHDVFRVGTQYPPAGTGEVNEEHILLNYIQGGGNIHEARAWAKKCNLKPNDPRRVFGMVEQNPNLHDDLRHDVRKTALYVIAPVICRFGREQQACCAGFNDDGQRAAGIDRTEGFFGAYNCWFSFRR